MVKVLQFFVQELKSLKENRKLSKLINKEFIKKKLLLQALRLTIMTKDLRKALLFRDFMSGEKSFCQFSQLNIFQFVLQTKSTTKLKRL